MRIAIASIGQETCSFTPTRTTVETFAQYGLYEGEELLTTMHDVGPIGGFFAAAQEEGLEIGRDLTPLPLIRGWAGASGALTDATLDYFAQKVIDGLRAAGPIEGFFFSLHGAAAAESEPDVEGALVAAARSVLGENVPIIAPIDHHANITTRMIDLLDGLVAHLTQPHDPFDTGKRAAHLLFATLRGAVKPTVAWRNIPLITHQEQFLTARGPMKRLFDRAREMETQPGVLSVSPCPMQPWLDVPEGGWSTVVVTDDDPALAQTLADDLAAMAWEMRDEFLVLESVPPAEAIRRASTVRRGPVLLSDTGDSVFGGAPGDSTAILRELLRQELPGMALLPMVDAEVVDSAIEAGVGAEISVELGGKLASEFNTPVALTATVAAIGGGRLHAKIIGLESFDAGRTVLLTAGPIHIVVSELEGVGGNHPIVYRQFGVEPADAAMIVMKTASNFQCYADITGEVIRVDTPGPTMSHMAAFPWRQIPRPMYPLDPVGA